MVIDTNLGGVRLLFLQKSMQYRTFLRLFALKVAVFLAYVEFF